MTEEWRDIKGYEGKYKISNKGRVMSIYKKNTPYKGGYRRTWKQRNMSE